MEAIGRKKLGSPQPAGRFSGVASCTRLMLFFLLAVNLLGGAWEASGHNGPMFAHFDLDGDGLLNMMEAELFMASVVADPASLAACPNASSIVLARDGDGDLRLNAREVEGMSWDVLQCIHDAGAICSATATVSTSAGSYACAAEHEEEHEEEEHADEHEEEEHADEHGHAEEETETMLTFPGPAATTWHCELAEDEHEEAAPLNSSPAERWGLGILAAVVVSVISLVGIFLVSFDMLSVPHLTDYMGALAVGAIIASVFLHMLPEAAVGDKDGRFAWRTGTSIMGGLMTAYLLESVVRTTRVVMGFQAHEHPGHECHDSAGASICNRDVTVPALVYAPSAEPIPGVGVPVTHPSLVKEIDDGPCCDHAPERLVMPPTMAVAAAAAVTAAPVDLNVVAGDGAAVELKSACLAGDSSKFSRDGALQVAAVASPATVVAVQQPAAALGHGHAHGGLRRAGRPSLKRRVSQKFLSTESVVFVILLGDFVHNVVDGLVIGASFSLCDTSAGWSITFATVLHEVPQELSDFIVLRRAGLSVFSALALNLASASSCIIGAIAGLGTAKISESTQSVLIAYCAGILVFVAMVDILPDLMTVSNVHGKWMATGHVIKRFLLIVACPRQGKAYRRCAGTLVASTRSRGEHVFAWSTRSL
eukprot:jgi/Mesvir1/13687/Mv02121-RA.1